MHYNCVSKTGVDITRSDQINVIICKTPNAMIATKAFEHVAIGKMYRNQFNNKYIRQDSASDQWIFYNWPACENANRKDVCKRVR